MSLRSLFQSIVTSLVISLSVTGCGIAPVVGTAIEAAKVVSGIGSSPAGVDASLQIGDTKTQVTGSTVGQRKTVKTDASVQEVTAQKSTVDQSANKVEQKKTEIGEVTGNVSVEQGPSTGLLVALGSGWPLFVTFLVWASYRRIKYGSARTLARSLAGTQGASEVLEDQTV